jgi:hypothetical protein
VWPALEANTGVAFGIAVVDRGDYAYGRTPQVQADLFTGLPEEGGFPA